MGWHEQYQCNYFWVFYDILSYYSLVCTYVVIQIKIRHMYFLFQVHIKVWTMNDGTKLVLQLLFQWISIYINEIGQMRNVGQVNTLRIKLICTLLVRDDVPSLWFCDKNLPGTVYPKKYAHGFVVLCFVVVMQSFIMDSHEVFIHIHQGCFAATGAIVRLPQCQWSKPDGYGKISQCITTTKHSKAITVCIFLVIYCICICVPSREISATHTIVRESLCLALYRKSNRLQHMNCKVSKQFP